MRQPLGATTAFGYDSRGNKVYERTPQGVETQSAFDANGCVLSESRTQRMTDGSVRTLTTTHTYDDKGRETATTDALGNTTRTEPNTWCDLRCGHG